VVEGWKFIKLWEANVGPKLARAGYKVAGDNATRTRGRSSELLALERDAKGSRFTVNLALAHEFARSFKDGKPVKLKGYEDAVFHARLGRLIESRDIWWGYGNDDAACENVINAVSDVAMAYADAWFATITDPGDAYLLLKKGDLGRENLWNLALYAWALGRKDEAREWLEKITSAPPHVEALKKEWRGM
jgi:hypothetical protein